MDSPPAFPPAVYQDRKTGLVIFGILTALLGGICALFIPLMFLGQSMSAKSGIEQSPIMLLPVTIMYGGLAVVLIWLGIGSMMAKRWARALLLIFSWCWLLIGIFSIGMMAFMLPQITNAAQAGAPPGQASASVASAMMIFTFGFLGVIFVVLPAVWVFFYGSKHVKATCEANDPVERWTDRCPLPVLAASLGLASGVPTMLMMPICYRGVFPAFGTFISGPLGSALYVVIAIIWGYAAWAFYKLNRLGWWVILFALILFSISAFLTYSRHDLMELYTLMGYPQAQIDLIQKYRFMSGQTMAWITLGGMIPFVGYLLYIRRFFPKPS
ncbi:MAG TPA: hypothetical protein VGM54_23090 [Chthoniobacter sp.]|jgi:hypothetical protein